MVLTKSVPFGPTHVTELADGRLSEFEVAPEDFGLERSKPGAIAGAGPDYNAQVLLDVLAGNPHPSRDAFVINAAAALVVAEAISPRAAAIQMQRVLDSGAGLAKLIAWRDAAARQAASRTVMASELAPILAAKRNEIASMRGQKLPSLPELRRCDLKRILPQPIRVLAEIKFKSPSAGLLSSHLSPAERAASYERGGASVVSVLCDAQFFGGSYEHLAIAKRACRLPILCKEFVIDEVQLDWARAYGADAVLLIARGLSRDELQRLHLAAIERGLLPLVEVATLDEAEWVNELGCSTIGVNARDLDTLVIDTDRASSILESLPTSRVRVHLSGMKTPSDVANLSKFGLDAVLIGEALMRQSDPEPLLRSIVQMAEAAV